MLTDVSGQFCVYHGGSERSSVAVCLLHGAGYSALTWSLMVEHLSSLADCRLLAIDLRGHGETQVSGDEEDLSGARMAEDVCQVLETVYSGQEDSVGVVLMGHSMGGALAAQVAERGVPGLLGLIVEDVVEGTAMEALAGMHSVLQNRPRQFQSLEQAVEWCVRSGQVRNHESARVSMPGQLVSADSKILGAKMIEDSDDKNDEDNHNSQGPAKREKLEASDSIKEEDEETGDAFKVPSAPSTSSSQVDRTPPQTLTGPQVFSWRIDLSRTEPHWSGWFQGLSQRFLCCQGAKLLLLAGVDRLDTHLTVGQMQV